VSVTVSVNGEPRAVAPGATLEGLLRDLDVHGGRGVAVAVDAEVVPQSQWPRHALADGARVEIVNAVQGG
jgi:sulfur carrier protein